MMIFTKKYNNLPICKKEILRYAGCRGTTDEINTLLDACIEEAKDKFSYNVCYAELNVNVKSDVCDFGYFSVRSKDLAKALDGQKKVVLFAATLGIEIDRLIKKYSKISPSKALMFQAIGAAQIEALCDTLCKEIDLNRRFSPGYGDLPLDIQKNIFNVLSCTKYIGLSLNDSLLMSPSKSVTAFAFSGSPTKNKCKFCNKTDCSLRGAL